MLSPFIINDRNLFLDRYPPGQVNRSLQAWDATDEYLLSYFDEHFVEPATAPKPLNVLVFNDNFGALACNLTDHNVSVVTDSFLAQKGIELNIENNHLDEERVNTLTSLAPLPEKIDVILYRIPKSKTLLIEQLHRISEHFKQTDIVHIPPFIASAKAKEIHTATLKEFEKNLGTTTTSLAVKKSRLVFSTINQGKLGGPVNPNSLCATWPLENTTFNIANLANVFAREKLDLGARLFLKHLPAFKEEQKVIDLGCGNGVLGLMALSQGHKLNLVFRDESFMAIESAKMNVSENVNAALAHATFSAGDCLSGESENSADIILCNPPFHQQHATTDHIAWQMFNESFKVLKKGGELRIVGNRQLGYHVKLKRIFGNCKTIASDQKFVILSAVKK